MDHNDITCQQFIRDLADYLAGNLGPDGIRDGELHLAVCPDCVSYLRNYEITLRLAADALRPEAAAGPGDATALPEGFADVILTARRRK